MRKGSLRHGLLQLILIILLFLLSTLIFGGWDKGPLTAGLFVGFQIYALLAKGASGNIDAVSAMGGSVLRLAIIFLVNLLIYYVLASLLLLLFRRKR